MSWKRATSSPYASRSPPLADCTIRVRLTGSFRIGTIPSNGCRRPESGDRSLAKCAGPAKRFAVGGEINAHVLEILRRVETTGEAVIVTDRGRPMVRVEPYFGGDDASGVSFRPPVGPA